VLLIRLAPDSGLNFMGLKLTCQNFLEAWSGRWSSPDS